MNRILSAVSPRVKAAKLLWQNAAQKGRRSPGSNGRFESGRPSENLITLPAKRPHPRYVPVLVHEKAISRID